MIMDEYSSGDIASIDVVGAVRLQGSFVEKIDDSHFLEGAGLLWQYSIPPISYVRFPIDSLCS